LKFYDADHRKKTNDLIRPIRVAARQTSLRNFDMCWLRILGVVLLFHVHECAQHSGLIRIKKELAMLGAPRALFAATHSGSGLDLNPSHPRGPAFGTVTLSTPPGE
jgi:hypothetical protein